MANLPYFVHNEAKSGFFGFLEKPELFQVGFVFSKLNSVSYHAKYLVSFYKVKIFHFSCCFFLAFVLLLVNIK